MTDIRARLMGVLEEHFVVMAKCDEDAWEQWEAAVDDLLSLPGIAIVEVPEGMCVSLKWDRDALLAAANAAEEH